jgi:hypothetical protein
MGRPALLRGVGLATGALATLLGACTQSFAGRVQAASMREEQRCLAEAMYWEARGEGRRASSPIGATERATGRGTREAGSRR